jgi:Domain of unknown function (DUF4430)
VARRRGSDLRPHTAVAAALCALAAAGCGIGAGDDAGEVELTVTRDYGAEAMVEGSEPISESDTVMRVLDRNAEIETRYGGGFVQSIDGLAGGSEGGRRSDWFFYVNGVESPIGAAEFGLDDGDRVWWDHRDWTAAMRVPAVVGSFPEPFVHGFRGERYEVAVACDTVESICSQVRQRLEDQGARLTPADGEGAGILVVVGPWKAIRSHPDLQRRLELGPDESGVFARFTAPGPILLTLLNRRGEPAGSVGKGAGLVAAIRPDEEPPTWLVTGTDRAGVESAASALDDSLRDRYAVVTEPGTEPIGVPVP